MTEHPDVIVIGAGGDGPALAWRLGDLGIDTLVLEAGPWHGNEQWEDPHETAGGTESSDPNDLSGELLDEQFDLRENATNDSNGGRFRFGPADRDRPEWDRSTADPMYISQIAGVGGTTLHYFGNHPRAYPYAFEEQDHWPIDYEELVPYYQQNEDICDVHPAPTTAKEEVFYEGAANAGIELIDQLNVVDAGYRPQPNAVTPPDETIQDDGYDGPFTYPDVEGDTLAGDHYQGAPTPLEAPVSEKSRKSSNVSYVPRALETGNVTIRPNTFVTNVTTDSAGWAGDPEATGVEYRDTWTGETGEIEADVVVMAAGCIETPRLWLNSDLPDNGTVGTGLTTHWFDFVTGVFDEETIEEVTGQQTIDPFVGHNAAARYDEPGVGCFEMVGGTPGIASFQNYGFSQAGYAFDIDVDTDAPWDSRGWVTGEDLKARMADYRRSLSILIITDDLPREDNGVSVDEDAADEHGPVADVTWEPHPDDDEKRDQLAETAADLLQSAGASHVHRADAPPLLLHLQSSMRMGEVVDENCEAYDVDRLFVGDHSAMANGLGGPNPTNTGQALALRTAERIESLYF
ncbi:GMC oxidoreductase [Natronorubrum daqingense]|uniref:Choline dehydrogenase n=1 Tax=Natronorubrum daqingense TaxID=588898 RepID=A0A1N7EKG5_9EURY|nr:GMC family oxidoreductase [Natronorubrum daqingense]APX97899.1 hypothetical protein BB347_15470 [Natronorubrum daqingense]SIR88509.1 Choline dehydrogenase [Natronorubrum daqingense]